MFVTNIFPPPLILQSNYTFSQDKSNFSNLESRLLSQINYLRTNPKVYFNYYKNYFDEFFIKKIMNIINKQSKKLNPLNTKKEIALAGRDYFNYLIENKIPKSFFDINKGNKAYFNLQQILSKYGQRKGKIFESLIINSISASEIVNKLIKDEKAIKMLLDPDMKYICITCGYVPQWENKCVIIDIIEDFVVYKNNDNNNGIQILNEIYLDEKMAKIEEKFKTRTHKYNKEITRNNSKIIEYNSHTTKENEKFKKISPIYMQDMNRLYYKTKDENSHKSFSFNKFHNFKKSNNNNNEIKDNNKNKTKEINNKEKYNKLKGTNLLLNLKEKNEINNKLTNKKKENKKKEYKIITKNLNLKNINIYTNTNTNIKKEKKFLKSDYFNDIRFHNNTDSFINKEKLKTISTKNENSGLKEFSDNTFQALEQINDISIVNHIKKQNSFFSLDTEISTILNPKKNESQENNLFNFTPNKQKQNQEQI